MRFVPNKRAIRRSFAQHPHAKGLVAEGDVTAHPNGRLAAKVLIFDRPKSLRAFWRKAVSGDIGPDCLGCVNALGTEVEDTVTGRRFLRGDPRYFCIVGLCVGWLSPEIIAHEAVHAGFCYEKRVRRNLFGAAAEFDEERIAYPTGAIADGIVRMLHAQKMYDRKPARRAR